MILYVESPKETTNKLLELIQDFSKVARYKIQFLTQFSSYLSGNRNLLGEQGYQCMSCIAQAQKETQCIFSVILVLRPSQKSSQRSKNEPNFHIVG